MKKKQQAKTNPVIVYAGVGIAVTFSIVALILALVTGSKPSGTGISNEEASKINTAKRNDAAILSTALISYRTNNRNKLPEITGGDSQITTGSGVSIVDTFYRKYLPDFRAYNGAPYVVQFVSSADASKISHGVNYLDVFYSATCDSDGKLVSATSNDAAVVFTDANESFYYCISN